VASLLKPTLRILGKQAAGILLGVGSAIVVKATLDARWTLAAIAAVALGVPATLIAWKQAQKEERDRAMLPPPAPPAPPPRRDLLPRLIALDTEAERLVRRLAITTDGGAHADSINWCRRTAEWLRAECLIGQAEILDPVAAYAQQEYGRPLAGREVESANDIRLAVEKVRSVVRAARDRIEAQIAGG